MAKILVAFDTVDEGFEKIGAEHEVPSMWGADDFVLSTDLLERLFELDLLGDGDAVVGDGGAPTSCLGQRCDPWGLGSP